MGVTRRVGVVRDPRYREHRAPEGHPERPARLAAVDEAIDRRAGSLSHLAPRHATDEEILRIHERAHLQSIAAAVSQAPAQLDPDTYVSPRSLEIARLAAGGSIELARAVVRGELCAGLAAVRPPGHHAETHRAMGFCLFNNAAIAAAALRAEERVERILILDWDVHHGNGTQQCFEKDPNLLYFSTHQYPFYPGTGRFDEAGSGPRKSTMSAGCRRSVPRRSAADPGAPRPGLSPGSAAGFRGLRRPSRRSPRRDEDHRRGLRGDGRDRAQPGR
jgi:acetoin utilization deacetylase AcuC-like enzyme